MIKEGGRFRISTCKRLLSSLGHVTPPGPIGPYTGPVALDVRGGAEAPKVAIF